MGGFKKAIGDIHIHEQEFHLVYRVCDCANAVSANGKRFFNADKPAVILRCLDSIRSSVSLIDRRIKLIVHVVQDRCSANILSDVVQTFGQSTRIYTPSVSGNAASFCSCVEIATQPDIHDNAIVFFLEDDYLFLDDDVFSKMVVAFQQLKKIVDMPVGIMPDDYPDRYVNRQCVRQIATTEVGNFARIHHSTCTFAVEAAALRQHKLQCMKFSRWPYIGEDASVNLMWRDVALFQPVTALTLHVQCKSTCPAYMDLNKLCAYFETRRTDEV